ncbi:uncharacterized protein LOC135370140 [Ornithodoros turicata]|uniref:uncharacterized protein LOC135370140 n=1 Tax=Ornithodoros turicata TaxID=34597 RepID=UPI00313A4B87
MCRAEQERISGRSWWMSLLFICTLAVFGVIVVMVALGWKNYGFEFRTNKAYSALRRRVTGEGQLEGKRVACIFRGRDASAGSYPEDGLCDFFIYDNITYRDGKIHSEDGLPVFCRRSRHARRTLYLAALSPDTVGDPGALNTTAFARAIRGTRGVCVLRGLGLFLSFDSGRSLEQSLRNITRIMRAMKRRLRRVLYLPMLFLGGQFLGLDQPSNRARYSNAVQRVIRTVDIFIAMTHVSASPKGPCVPQPTATWNADSFNDSSMPTMSAALDLIRHVKYDRSRHLMMISVTMAVVSYRGSNSIASPPTLGGRCTHALNSPYHQGCKPKRAVPNRYSQYETIVFDVNPVTNETRSYETVTSLKHKVLATRKEIGNGTIGWALFDAEQEDSQGSSCIPVRRPEPFKRIKLIRRLA